ncbi:MAG: hypothetical protein HC790_00485 [Acaryochloridaceae cyanobacterium CSU_3_4]|nr:hypothetical protein [Acaryochloridaceae cyanobacterium CSU_3_4]
MLKLLSRHCSASHTNDLKLLNRGWSRPRGRYLGLVAWLPIPVIALLFWFGGQGLTQQLLSQDYSSKRILETHSPVKIRLNAVVQAMEVEIKPQEGFTKVTIETTDSALKALKLEFPVTDVADVEAAIANELGIQQQTVSQLARYQIKTTYQP